MRQRLPIGTRVVVLAVVCAALIACSGAAAAPARIEVSDARIPLPAGPNGAAYFTLRNTGGATERLVAVSCDVAQAVELHESVLQDGALSMRPLEGLEIPANGAAVLEPGGPHVMLVNVDPALAIGDSVELGLTFARSEPQTIFADVVSLTVE